MKFGFYLETNLLTIIITQKRFLLMKIYALTFSFFIFDRSEKFQNTKFTGKTNRTCSWFWKLKQKFKKKTILKSIMSHFS